MRGAYAEQGRNDASIGAIRKRMRAQKAAEAENMSTPATPKRKAALLQVDTRTQPRIVPPCSYSVLAH